jgi:hypothetical protein
MNASGLFFLTGRPALVNTRDAAGETRKEWRFPLCERTSGKGVDLLTGVWIGTDGAAFVAKNAQILKAGVALTIEFSRIRPDGDRLMCRMVSCTIAPPRWPAAESMQQFGEALNKYAADIVAAFPVKQ